MRAKAVLVVMGVAALGWEAGGARANAVPAAAVSPGAVQSDRATVAAAVERALLYLAREQRANGAFAEGHHEVVLTALATLSFLSAGQPPGDGKYGLVVQRAADFLVSKVPEEGVGGGYVGGVDGSRMYGQAIVAIALSELAASTTDEARREKLLAALGRVVPVILEAQKVEKDTKHAGGWRYEPTSVDSDLSLSGWCAQALRAARGVGERVPDEALTRAMNYVLQCRTATGGFSYQAGGNAEPGTTGSGALTLLLLSSPSAPPPPELGPALELIGAQSVKFEDRFAYYATHAVFAAAHHAGPPVSNRVAAWAVPLLLSLQQPDGGFPPSKSSEEPGRVYATAMATITLSIPTSPLPSHRR